jgi:hypothetical protein
MTSRPPNSAIQYAYPSTATGSPAECCPPGPVEPALTGRASKKSKYVALAMVTGSSRTASPSPIEKRPGLVGGDPIE